MKITFFGTTTLLFDDGSDQVFFDAHMTRPSLFKYICGSWCVIIHVNSACSVT